MKTINDLPLSVLNASNATGSFLVISGIDNRVTETDKISFDGLKGLITDDITARLDAFDTEYQSFLTALNTLTVSQQSIQAQLTASLTTQIATVSASITAEATARATADQAEADLRVSLETQYKSDIANANAAIINEQTVISSALGAEATARQTLEANFANSVATVAASVVDERTARVSAIAAEATARLALAASISTSTGSNSNALITNEATARATADSALSTRIETIEADYTTHDAATGIATSIATAKITDEASARASADGALSSRIQTVEADYTTHSGATGIATTIATAKVADEASARATADGALATRIQTVEANYTTNDTVTGIATTIATAKVSEEATARANAISSLAQQVSTVSAGTVTINANLVSDVANWTFHEGTQSSVETQWGSYLIGNSVRIGFTLLAESEFIYVGPSTFLTVSADLLCYAINSDDATLIQLSEYDSSQNYIGDFAATPLEQGNINFDDTRARNTFSATGQTGTNTNLIKIRWYSHTTTDPHTVGVGIRRVKLEQGQIVTPYSSDGQAAYSAALVKSETAARTTADTALANQITQLSATVVSNANLVADVTTWTFADSDVIPTTTSTWGSYIGAHGRQNGVSSWLADSGFVSCDANTYYTVSADMYCLNISPDDSTYIQISEYDINQNYMRDIVHVNAQNINFNDTRPRFSGSGQSSSGNYIRVRWYVTPAASGTPSVGVGLRRVKLERGQVATAYSSDNQAAYASAQLAIEQSARVSSDTALATQITSLSSSVNNNNAALTNEQNTRATAVNALAQQYTNLSATVSANINANLVADVSTWILADNDVDTSVVSTWGSYIGSHGRQNGVSSWLADSVLVVCDSNTYYTVSADMYCLNINPNDSTYIQISEYDSNQNFMRDLVHVGAQNVNFDDARTRFSGSGQTTNGAFIRVRWYVTPATTGTPSVGVGLRRVKLERGQVATSYSSDGQAAYASAQILTEQSSRATADTALSQRIDTLSSTVTQNGNTFSSAIATEQNTRADAVSAVANQINSVSSNLNGVGSRVSTTEQAISTLNGKASAYWTTTAVAGNNRAQLSIHADANGGAGVDIVGDVAIAGNLLVSGTVTASKFLADQGVDVYAIVPGTLGFKMSGGDSNYYSVAANDNKGTYAISSGTFTRYCQIDMTLTGTFSGGGGLKSNGDPNYALVNVDVYYYLNGTWNYWFNVGIAQNSGGNGSYAAFSARGQAYAGDWGNVQIGLFFHASGDNTTSASIGNIAWTATVGVYK